jgi:hypothetical protein
LPNLDSRTEQTVADPPPAGVLGSSSSAHDDEFWSLMQLDTGSNLELGSYDTLQFPPIAGNGSSSGGGGSGGSMAASGGGTEGVSPLAMGAYSSAPALELSDPRLASDTTTPTDAAPAAGEPPQGMGTSAEPFCLESEDSD